MMDTRFAAQAVFSVIMLLVLHKAYWAIIRHNRAKITNHDPNVRLLSLFDKIHDAILGHRKHEFGFPFTTPRRKYPVEYNTHQVCVTCGQERFFNFDTMTAGPMYRRKFDVNKAQHAGRLTA